MSLDAMKQALEALERGETKLRYEAITALRAAIEQAQDPETELETYKRLYELRGKALERPCSNCGHQPAKIKAMAQPEQEPVAWMVYTLDGKSVCVTDNPADFTDQHQALPLYTYPRQWQGLTEVEIVGLTCECVDDGTFNMDCSLDFARAIEAKLKEKNT